MSSPKVDLTEDEWKAQIDGAFMAGMSMADVVPYHLVLQERAAIVSWLKQGASIDSDTPELTTAWHLALLIGRGAHLAVHE